MVLQIYYLCNEKYDKTTSKVIYYLFPHLIRKNYCINLFILYYQKHLILKVDISFHYQFVASCFHFCSLGNSVFHLLVGGKRFEQLEVSKCNKKWLVVERQMTAGWNT